MKRYKDHEHLKGVCYDCRKPKAQFVDLMVSDEVWEQINPTYEKGKGELCPTCIGHRIKMLVVKENVKAAFNNKSG